MTTSSRKQWLAPAGLIVLSLVPVAVGVMRAGELASNPAVTEDNARFLASPIPIFAHIIGSVLYAILGALQFVPSLRQHRWHRITGRILIPCGLASAGSGLWMTLFNDLPWYDGPLLNGFRIFFGSFMIASLILGFAAIRRRDFTRHRAWMMRAYAIALGAGTQVFTHFGWLLAFGEPGVFEHALAMAAGWTINLAVAEWIIRRPASAAVSLDRRAERSLSVP